jgi:ABC-type transporter Mla subunit MlaD
MARTVSRTNVIAGVFVLASAALAVVMSVIVSGAQDRLRPRTAYIIRFTLEQGGGGLKPGSNVNLGGQKVGNVSRVEFHRDVAGGPPTAVDVHVRIDADVRLFEDAVVFLERPLLGNIGALNIVSTGDGTQVARSQNNSPLLQEGEVLSGTVAPPAFLSQAGYGPEQARQFRMMVQQASEAVERVTRMTQRAEEEFDPTLRAIRVAVDDVSSVTARLRERADPWTRSVDRVLASADDAASRLRPMFDRFDATVAEFQEAVKANRPELDRIMASLSRASERIDQESIPLLSQALEQGRAGADEFAAAGRTFNSLIQQEGPNLQRILANLRLAADQIKLTGVEVRRNPWRLLYQPRTKELESELFYDSARTYAEAVSDLRAASEALQAVSADGRTPDGETVQHILERLREAFGRYRQAEQRLLDRMVEKGR